MIPPGQTSLIGVCVVLALSQRALAQDNTGWGTSASARAIAGAIIGIILGLIVITFAFIIYRRHTRIYGTPQMPSIELRRVSSYVSVFTRRQNTELGANDQGPGYSAPAYSAEPPPYVGPEVELDPKRDARKEYDADLPVKHANASVDVVDAEGMYEYDVPPPPPSPRTISSSSTSLPPPTPPNEASVQDTWYKGYP
ncbi:hypothetical protein FOMPIDRAFT_1063286 [Fomitopsis schrenkii]|uniref:Uncharacterized protein n=1 Tax=Fomitopsis schrenkii TaxID=2126942 RepID=S8EXE3_FOMSC|nr:hypothetical protein FOMPIDRAFT_1063286 [Fomitopsis schrenkii]